MKFCYDDSMRIVDVHTHGLAGHSTSTTNPDEILEVARLHGIHGVTDVVLTIYPGPVEIMREHMAAVGEAIKRQRLAISDQGSVKADSEYDTQNSRLVRILGIHLEGPFLNPNKAGALDAASLLKPSEKVWERLIEGFEDIVRIVTVAPELEGAKNLIKAISSKGIIVSLGHSEATYEEAENAFHAGAKGITHLFNAMRAFHHREPGIAGFGLMNPHIYVEVIAGPSHLNSRTIELIFKVKNHEKIVIISDSIKGTKVGAGQHALMDSAGTLEGGSMTITESASRLIDMGIDEAKVVGCISTNPLSYLARTKQC